MLLRRHDWIHFSSRAKNHSNDISVLTNRVGNLAREVDHNSGHVGLELAYTNPSHGLQITRNRLPRHVHERIGKIQHQTIGIAETKSNVGKGAIPVHVDLGLQFISIYTNLQNRS